MDAFRVAQPWKPDDVIEAVRLQMIQDLAERAQLYSVSPNVRVYTGARGGTAIGVDETRGGGIGTAQLYLVTRGSTLDNPNLVKARPHVHSFLWDVGSTPAESAGDTWIACVAAHATGDVIVAEQPAGGSGQTDPDDETGNTPVTWREWGVFGQEFEVVLQSLAGVDGPTVTRTYDVYAASNHYALGGEKIAEGLSPWRPVLSKISGAATRGRAKFYTQVTGADPAYVRVALMEAFELHSNTLRSCS